MVQRMRRIDLHFQKNSASYLMLLAFYLDDGVIFDRQEVLAEVLRYLDSRESHKHQVKWQKL